MARFMKRKHVMRFQIPGTEEFAAIPLRVTKSWKTVTMPRVMADALNGVSGSVVECMDAKCAFRHKAFFPHPYYFIEVSRSRVYVVSKKDKQGIPTDCVLYLRPRGESK